MPSMRPAVRRTIDVGIVTAISIPISLVSQRWTGFNSPDSEFYASLALFGSEVTDRAVEPAYPWTRLGYILPVRGLVTSLGPWAGFEIWRIFLISVIVGSVYAMGAIAGRTRSLVAALAAFVGLNTVVLAFAGNTYLTGTAVAALFALIATGVSYLGSHASDGRGLLGAPRWTTGVLSGALLGWLIMINPYAFILGGGMWTAVRVVALMRLRVRRWRLALIDSVGVLTGAVVTVGSFLVLGRGVFPRLDWWATYVEWNSRLDYTVFIIDSGTWQRDSALLVVLVSVIVALTTTALFPARRWAWAAAAVAIANVAITAIMMIGFTGPWLEAPTYVAKLWPGALSALVLSFLAIAPGTRESESTFPALFGVGAVMTVPLLIWTGRFDRVLETNTGWIVAGAISAIVVIAAVMARLKWNQQIALLLIVAMSSTFVGAQILQNGRGLLGGYGQYPFRSAFVDFNYQSQMETKIAVQRWLLAATSPQDTIALWTDPESLTADVAAMQLWGGYNIFTLEATLDRNTTQRLEEIRPSVIAMYAPDPQQIDDLYGSLPPWSLPSEMECTAERYLGIGTGQVHVCLTRLTWVG